MRAISIVFCVIHIYWFCYQTIIEWGINIGVVDNILLNFNRTTGLFTSVIWTKIFALIFLALSCLGTKGVKEEKIKWRNIYLCLFFGFILFFLNFLLLSLNFLKVLKVPTVATVLYIFTLSTGYILLLLSGIWMSRLLKNNLMDDVFNLENESFQQEVRLMENPYSVNLPTRFFYKKKWNRGWINVVNPFRATIVLGTPGSGKSFAVVNNYIKQHIQKGFSIGQYGFGNDWYTADRKQTINYKNNTSDFFLWTIGDDLVSTSGYYPALQVTETTDEDNRVTTQYTDLQGRVLKFKTILLNILNSRIGDEE